MPYVIKVMDRLRHPGRVGWIGQQTKKEGPDPVGIRPFQRMEEAERIKRILIMKYPGAHIQVMELVKKGARR